MSTGCKSSHNSFLDVSRSNGGLRISGWIGQLVSWPIAAIYCKSIILTNAKYSLRFPGSDAVLSARSWHRGASTPGLDLEVSPRQVLALRCFHARSWHRGVSTPGLDLEVSPHQVLTSRCLHARSWPRGVSTPGLDLEVSPRQVLALRCL